MTLQVANNAYGELNADINDSVTTIVLKSGNGARFPSLTGSQYFYATLIDTNNNLEIVKATARSSDTLTVVRAQDGTSARSFSANDRIELRPVAAFFSTYQQKEASVDMNGTELILDADADTSITADTDDQIDIKIGGTDEVTLSSSGIVINEGGNDRDFRIEGDSTSHLLFVDGGNDVVNIGGDLASYASGDANDLVIGATANAYHGITIVGGSSTGGGAIYFSDGTDSTSKLAGHIYYSHQYDELVFGASNGDTVGRFSGDRNLINHGGWFKQTKTTTSGGQFYNGTNITGYNGAEFNEFNSNVSNETVLAIKAWHSGTDQEGLVVAHAANTDNTSSTYISCVNDINGSKFKVEGNGNVESATNSYGSTSDERLKTIIGDASSQWDDIKGLKFKKYKRYYSDEVHLGLISQEAEKVSPNIVYDSKPSITDIIHDSTFGTLYTKEDEDKGNVPKGRKVGDIKEIKEQVKSIKYSVLYMKAVKALQEAMARIEILEAKVKALEET